MNNHKEQKTIDPVKIVEEIKRREDINWEGKLILKFKRGRGVIYLRESYDINVTDGLSDEDIQKHYGKLMKWHVYGKTWISLSNGTVTKFNIERQLPSEKFYL